MASKHMWGSKLTVNGSIETDTLGVVRTEYDTTEKCYKSYTYVFNAAGESALVSGDVACWLDDGTSVIGSPGANNKIAGNRNNPAGVAIGAIHNNSFGWLQCSGHNSSIKMIDENADGDEVLVAYANHTANTIGVDTASPYKPIGYMYGTSEGSKSAMLCCNDNNIPSAHIWGSKVTYNGSIEIHRLGILRTEYDEAEHVYKTYRFIYNGSGSAMVHGDCAAFITGGTSVVHDSTADYNCPAGVTVGAIDSNSYGWLQCGGLNTSVRITDTPKTHCQGEVLVMNGAGIAATIATGGAITHKPLGYNCIGGSYHVMLSCAEMMTP